MSSEGPLVSVIITIYNQLDLLPRALSSVLEQDYKNIQIIIGDDASTDGDVEAFLKSYPDERILYIRQTYNLGRSPHYKSLLINHAIGEWVTLLNGDDFFTNPFYISSAIKLLLSSEDMILVFGKTGIYVEDSGKIICDSVIDQIPTMMNGNDLLLNQTKGHIIPHITSIYHRAHAIELDFYEIRILSEDWEGLLRIIQGKNVGYINQLSGLYGRHHNNVSKSLDMADVFANIEYILSPYRLALEKGQIEKSILYKWKEDMIYRYIVKIYIKLSLWDRKVMGKFLALVAEKLPDTHARLKNDYKIKLFELIKNNDLFLKLAFKYYLKQEAVIEDFLQHRKFAKGLHYP